MSLCVQDTSYLDYDTHKKTQGLGSISKAYKLAVYIVSTQEINPPADAEAINWILITNLAVYNFEDTIERI